MEQNQITLRGTVRTPPEFSHENHGRRFSRFLLETPRLSGALDLLPVLAQEDMARFSPGDPLTVVGQIRSHNVRREDGRHLDIFVFASSLYPEPGEPLNQAALEGELCREPTFRRTPLGREICDMMLAVPRAWHRADYLPCIAWGRTAQVLSEYHTGDPVSIRGRLQSRIYTKVTPEGPRERTAYEISAMTGT